MGTESRSTRLGARTAALAVFHATPRPSATRATVRCWHTMPACAHRSRRRDSFSRSVAAAPPVRLQYPAGLHRAIRLEALTRHPQTELVEAGADLGHGWRPGRVIAPMPMPRSPIVREVDVVEDLIPITSGPR